MELRTDYQEKAEEVAKSGDAITQIIDKYMGSVKENPTMKLRLMNAAQQNGIDPVLLAPLVDASEEELQALQQAQAQQAAQQQQAQQSDMPQGKAYEQLPADNENNMPEPADTDVEANREIDLSQEISPEELTDFVEQLIGFTDEEMTLRELHTFAEGNPDIVQTAINIAF